VTKTIAKVGNGHDETWGAEEGGKKLDGAKEKKKNSPTTKLKLKRRNNKDQREMKAKER